MTKSELISAVSLKFPDITQKDVECFVNGIFEGISKVLVNGSRIELRGFGSLEVRSRKPRSARNPKTGQKVSVESRRTVVFNCGKDFNRLIREEAVVESEPATEQRAGSVSDGFISSGESVGVYAASRR